MGTRISELTLLEPATTGDELFEVSAVVGGDLASRALTLVDIRAFCTPEIGSGVGTFTKGDLGKILQIQSIAIDPEIDAYQAFWTELSLPILNRKSDDANYVNNGAKPVDVYPENRTTLLFVGDGSGNLNDIEWGYTPVLVDYSYFNVSAGGYLQGDRNGKLSFDGSVTGSIRIAAEIIDLADIDYDPNNAYPITGKSIIFGGSIYSTGEYSTATQNVNLTLTGDCVNTPTTVSASVIWCRNAFAVSISGSIEITTDNIGSGIIDFIQGSSGGFNDLIGQALDNSAFGTAVVEDKTNESPTNGQVVAYGFLNRSDTTLRFYLPSIGNYRIHFSGHIGLATELYAGGV